MKLFLALAGLVGAALASDTYHHTGNPYNPKTDVVRKATRLTIYKFLRRNRQIPSPETGILGDWYYPDKKGTYPVINWVGGMYSIFPQFLYTDILESMARKGFIVVYNCGIKVLADADAWIQQMEWDQKYLNEILGKQTRNKVQGDLTKQTAFCHSSGCWNLKIYSLTWPDRYNGYYYGDPVITNNYNHTDGTSIIDAVIDTTAFVTIDHTEACGRCCLFQKDNQMVFDSYPNSEMKIKEMVKGVGHCSMLTYANYNLCKYTEFCESPPANRRQLAAYHDCLVGKMTAFFTDANFNDSSMRTYYQDTNAYCTDLIDMDNEYECAGQYCEYNN